MDTSCEAANASNPRRGIPNAAAFGCVPRDGRGREAARGVEAVRAFDSAGLEAAIDRWGDMVLRLATARLGNAADAEDVFQTVFLRLHQATTAFRDDAHLKAWLLRVTVNCCNDVHRSPWRKRRSAFDEVLAENLPAPIDERRDQVADRRAEALHDDLAAALARLSPKQRTAVHLFYFEDYSTDEIARITGERPATVRSHLHRARKALKLDLGAHS